MTYRIGKRSVVFILAASVFLSASLASGQSRRPSPQRSYDAQMAQMRKDLRYVDEELEANYRAMQKAIFDMELDSTKAGYDLAGVNPALSKGISAFKDAMRIVELTKNFHDADFGAAVANSTKLIISVLAKTNPEIRGAQKAEEYLLLKPLQLIALSYYQNKLIEARLAQERAYTKLQYQQNQVDFDKWLRNLRGYPEEARAGIQQWLKQNQANAQSIAGAIIKGADAPTAYNVARGLRIIDPNQWIWDVNKIPGINPDFIKALEGTTRDFDAWWDKLEIARRECPVKCDEKGNCEEEQTETCVRAKLETRAAWKHWANNDRYPDGSYIPAFGQPRGIAVNARSRRTAERGSTGSDLKGSSPNSMVGGMWKILPGSWFTSWDESSLGEREKNMMQDAGWEGEIKRIGPGHFQYTTQTLEGDVELNGTETKASGEKNIAEENEYMKTDTNVRVEVWLSEGKLYEKLFTTITERYKNSDRVIVQHKERYRICAYQGASEK